ncbi:MAG TPA: hypothetical protein VFQ15_03880 [Jiangellaceae bacterium]|nr:hypothetical protein [Jiangellaceae bacterium]
MRSPARRSRPARRGRARRHVLARVRAGRQGPGLDPDAAQPPVRLRATPLKVNAANPGYCATDLNGHRGFRTAEQGAEAIVHLATLPEDGPSGILYGHLWRTEARPGDPEYGTLPW